MMIMVWFDCTNYKYKAIIKHFFAEDFFSSDPEDENTEETTLSPSNDNEGSKTIEDIPEFDIEKLNFKGIINYPLSTDPEGDSNNKQ